MTSMLTSIHGRKFGLDSSDNVLCAVGLTLDYDGNPITLTSNGEAAWGAALTAATASADVDGTIFSTSTEVTLGSYANAINGKLDFGTAGAVTGLGGVICAELDLGPGTTSGSYACFEAELNCPTSGSTGTRTSFMSMNAWGANVAAVDTSGFLFDIGGLTAGSGKLLATGTTAGTLAASLRVNVGGTTYYLNLYDAAAH